MSSIIASILGGLILFGGIALVIIGIIYRDFLKMLLFLFVGFILAVLISAVANFFVPLPNWTPFVLWIIMVAAVIYKWKKENQEEF